jgi:hypothetical protein
VTSPDYFPRVLTNLFNVDNIYCVILYSPEAIYSEDDYGWLSPAGDFC